MDQIGKYQDQIDALPPLDIEVYERIFKIFKDSIDSKEFYFYNILKKIEFPVLDEDVIGYENVLVRTPMTTLSHNIYGNIQSWWIIYLLNKEKFDTAPFWVEGGIKIKYILPSVISQIYTDITQSTIFNGRHF
jgi:hypothetical protein